MLESNFFCLANFKLDSFSYIFNQTENILHFFERIENNFQKEVLLLKREI